MITVRERLTKARDLMAKGFCKGSLALDKDGYATEPGAPDAARHCILGALLGASPQDGRRLYLEVAPLIVQQLPAKWRSEIQPDMCTIVGYNNANATTQADMVSLLDKTIAALPA